MHFIRKPTLKSYFKNILKWFKKKQISAYTLALKFKLEIAKQNKNSKSQISYENNQFYMYITSYIMLLLNISTI